MKAWRLGAAKFNQIKQATGAKIGDARHNKPLATALGMALRDPKRHRPT